MVSPNLPVWHSSVVDGIHVTVFATIWIFSAVISDINEFHVSINTTYICFAFDGVISRDKIFKHVFISYHLNVLFSYIAQRRFHCLWLLACKSFTFGFEITDYSL